MKFRRWKSLREHAAFAAKSFRKRVPFYRQHNIELTPESHTLLWQNRRYIISIICKMYLVNFVTNDDTPKLREWRKGSIVNGMITRIALITLCAQRTATLTQLAYVCEGVASREKVRQVIKDGEKLGLLERSGKDGYMVSDELAEELFKRMALKIRHPDTVEFSKMCMTIANVEGMIQSNPFDREEDHPLNVPITLPNAQKEGLYPEALDPDEDADPDR